MANRKQRIEETRLIRSKLVKAMYIPRTVREAGEKINLKICNVHYHIHCLIQEGYIREVGMQKNKLAPSKLYKKIAYMGEYVMQARALPIDPKEKIIKNVVVDSPNSRIFKHFNDSNHFSKMNASKTKAKNNYFVSGSILSGVF